MLGLFNKNRLNLEEYIATSVEGLKMATDAHSKAWHFGDEETWNIEQDEGNIVFVFSNGTVATASVQIIGTYNTDDGTFMWGWDHASVIAELQTAALQVKAFAKKHKLKELLTNKVSCSEHRAWEYTALAMRISEANCAYRAEASPGTYVCINFGEVALARET